MPHFTLKPYNHKTLAYVLATSLFACNPKQLPQIVCFEVIPANIMEGQSTQIKWEVSPSKQTRSIALKGIKDNLENIGQLSLPNITEKNTKDITLEVGFHSPLHKKLHYINETKKMQIDKPFFMGEDTVAVGSETHLEWKLNPEASDIWMRELVEGKEILIWENLPSEANYKIKPTKNTRFELFVIQPNPQKNTEDTLKYVHDTKVAHGFFTGTRTVLAGEEARLIWKVFPNLHDLIIEERENEYTRHVLKTNLPITGFQVVKPTTNTEYILVLISEETQTRFKHKIEVVNAIFTGTTFAKPTENNVLHWRATTKAKNISISEQLPDGTYRIIKENLPLEGKLELNKLPLGAHHYTLHVETKQETSEYTHSILITDKNTNDAKIYASSRKKTETKTNSEENSDHHTRQSVDMSFEAEVMNEPMPLDRVTVFFDFEKNKIDAKYTEKLDSFVQYLQKHENAIVDITGFSDMFGSTKGCQKVSDERALAVRDYFLSKGIEEYRLLYRGMGRAMPLHVLENTKQQAQENRRAEVVLMDNK